MLEIHQDRLQAQNSRLQAMRDSVAEEGQKGRKSVGADSVDRVPIRREEPPWLSETVLEGESKEGCERDNMQEPEK